MGVAERWYQRTALEDLLGVSWEKVNEDRLYRGLDALHDHKEELTQHLLQKYQSWFGVGFEFLIYDVTSTFFEGQVVGNAKAARGYSRDNRPDCKRYASAWSSARKDCRWRMKSLQATAPT